VVATGVWEIYDNLFVNSYKEYSVDFTEIQDSTLFPSLINTFSCK